MAELASPQSPHPAWWIYNVRDTLFDPCKPHQVPPRDVDVATEWPCLLVPREVIGRRGGPITRELTERVLNIAPEAERDHLRFTVRIQAFNDGVFPAQTPLVWHGDYAHGLSEVRTRCKVHSYVLITAGPFTTFIQPPNIWLPDTRAANAAFIRALAAAKFPTFTAEPWTLLAINATELHTANTWRGANHTRLFFRATYDPIRFPHKR